MATSSPTRQIADHHDGLPNLPWFDTASAKGMGIKRIGSQRFKYFASLAPKMYRSRTCKIIMLSENSLKLVFESVTHWNVPNVMQEGSPGY